MFNFQFSIDDFRNWHFLFVLDMGERESLWNLSFHFIYQSWEELCKALVSCSRMLGRNLNYMHDRKRSWIAFFLETIVFHPPLCMVGFCYGESAAKWSGHTKKRPGCSILRRVARLWRDLKTCVEIIILTNEKKIVKMCRTNDLVND